MLETKTLDNLWKVAISCKNHKSITIFELAPLTWVPTPPDIWTVQLEKEKFQNCHYPMMWPLILKHFWSSFRKWTRKPFPYMHRSNDWMIWFFIENALKSHKNLNIFLYWNCEDFLLNGGGIISWGNDHFEISLFQLNDLDKGRGLRPMFGEATQKLLLICDSYTIWPLFTRYLRIFFLTFFFPNLLNPDALPSVSKN